MGKSGEHREVQEVIEWEDQSWYGDAEGADVNAPWNMLRVRRN